MSEPFLKGYRALDLTGLSGQMSGRILADLGMEVVKIEPPGGDPVRNLAPFITSANGQKLSTTFAHLNAGKASKVLDLSKEADRAALRKLVETADVVVESSQPGELAAKGLDYKSLAQINPGIVMASITGFGQTGPKKNLACNDLVALAESGFLYISGDPSSAGDARTYHSSLGQRATNRQARRQPARIGGARENISVQRWFRLSLRDAPALEVIFIRLEGSSRHVRRAGLA